MSGTLDPVTLQVLVGGMRAVCDEMGAVLVRSAHSANIKERRDAALFDSDGAMVMQAEHIPVHLGAMPDAVAAVLGEDHRPGDVWLLNDPYRGGTHLPDITAVSPSSSVTAWPASRPPARTTPTSAVRYRAACRPLDATRPGGVVILRPGSRSNGRWTTGCSEA